MKKQICLLLAALLFCLTGIALAEQNPADAFEHGWVDDPDANKFVEIWFDGEAWNVSAVLFIDDEAYSITFDRCFYDEARNALICEDGLMIHGFFEDEDEEVPVDIEGAPAAALPKSDPPEVAADGFGAVLTVDEAGLLHWTGSDGAVADQAYINGDYEDDGLFVGEWECGSAWISISLRWGVYDVLVTVDMTEDETLIWQYYCTLDESGRLAGTGSKSVEVYYAFPEEIIETEIYTDGEAVFTLNGDTLLWNDAVENAGQDVTFSRWTRGEE